jgi:hypothetical protein
MKRSAIVSLVICSSPLLGALGCSGEAVPLYATDSGRETDARVDDTGPALRDDAGLPMHEDAGPVLRDDAGLPMREDAGAPMREDAGPPMREDAGPPMREDAGPPMREDAGPATVADGGPRPSEDAGTDACTPTTYYADCDSDGFAQAGSGTPFCAPPGYSPACSSAGGRWITRAPTGLADTDCNDLRRDVNPSVTAFSSTAITGAPASVDFDYSCDAVEERERSSEGSCTPFPDGCRFVAGWRPGGIGAVVPACGETGQWLEGCRPLDGRCVEFVGPSVQRCR